jgi:hypothetical protein
MRRMELISRMHAQSGKPEDILGEIAKAAGQCAKERENASAAQRILREAGSELGGQVKGSASAAEIAELMGQLQKALEEDRLDRGALERALRNARQDLSDQEAAAQLDELLNVLSREDFKGFAERLGSFLQENLRDMAAMDAIQARMAASEDAIAKALGEYHGPRGPEVPEAAAELPRQGTGGGGGADLFPGRIPDATGTGIREPGNPTPIPDMSAEEIAGQREQIMKQQAWPTDYDEAIKGYFSGKQ